MLQFLPRRLRWFLTNGRTWLVGDIERRAEIQAVLLGRLLARTLPGGDAPVPLREVEFRVFSQGGEDGIIQYLLSRIPVPDPIFVEFGVENYRESNTRFLLWNNYWRGLVIDSSPDHIEYIRRDEVSWRFELEAVCSFVTAENINGILAGRGLQKDIGLLSIDMDGNDYWVWQAIDAITPRIVVCEYNSLFGRDPPIVIPYDPAFCRFQAHYTGLYYGASLSALELLARRKGYVLVGSNSYGSNAFFVREDLAAPFARLTPAEAYVYSRARQSRDTRGKLSFLSGKDRVGCITHLPVMNVVTGQTAPLGEVLAPPS